jgi:hypothetical protein
VDALSTPPKANAIVDQKITSFRLMLGTSDGPSIGVADPKRLHDTAPSTIRSPAGIHAAIPPALLSHLPTFNPATFSVTASARPAIDAVMKYVLLVDHACHDGPPMNRALPAAK